MKKIVLSIMLILILSILTVYAQSNIDTDSDWAVESMKILNGYDIYKGNGETPMTQAVENTETTMSLYVIYGNSISIYFGDNYSKYTDTYSIKYNNDEIKLSDVVNIEKNQIGDLTVELYKNSKVPYETYTFENLVILDESKDNYDLSNFKTAENILFYKVRDIGGVSQLTNATNITVGGSDFIYPTGNINELVGLQKLQYIKFTTTEMTGDISALKNLDSLYHIELVGNDLTGDLSSVRNLTKLNYLSISSSKVTGELSDMSKLIDLEILELYDIDTKGDLSSLLGLNKVKTLHVMGHMTGDIENMPKLPSLTHFYLISDYMTGNVSSLSNSIRFVTVYLDGDNIIGDLSDYSSLSNLEYIYVDCTQMTGDISSLAKLEKLEYIVLREAPVTGAIGILSVLPKLINLVAFNTNCTGTLNISGVAITPFSDKLPVIPEFKSQEEYNNYIEEHYNIDVKELIKEYME